MTPAPAAAVKSIKSAVVQENSMNSVNEFRKKNDVFFEDTGATFCFEGVSQKMYGYVTNSQLKNRTLWARFVNQFRFQDDSADKGWRGEYWGKMMRGACFVYSYTKDKELFEVLKETVEDILTTANDGIISSYARENEFIGWDMWCRKYVLLGLQYFMEICDDDQINARIVSTMCACLDYIMEYVGPDKIAICKSSSDGWRGLNASSILEPVVRLYMITGEGKYLDFAKHIVDCGGTSVANLVDLALEDITNPYQYPITKAYEMISFFDGVLEYYRATGEEKYKTAVMNFARRVAKEETTIIGGIGCTEELFDHARTRQTEKPLHEVMQETCVTVTWMKFCMQLLMATGDMRFANMYEKAFYNAYLGAFNFKNNMSKGFEKQLVKYPEAVKEPLAFDSYSPLINDTRGKLIGGLKVMRDNHIYGCCVCIASAGIGVFHKIAAMKTRFGIAINMYEQGKIKTATPSGQQIVFDIKTAYPVDERVDITLDLKENEPFELRFRVPEWSGNTMLYVNDESMPIKPYEVIINRNWKKGDKVSLVFDMTPQVHRPETNPTDFVIVDLKGKENYLVGRVVKSDESAKYYTAITRGPLVLAGDERLGSVDTEPIELMFDIYDNIECVPTNRADFDTQCEYTVKLKNNQSITLVDYASAGSDWTKKCTAWLKTKHIEI